MCRPVSGSTDGEPAITWLVRVVLAGAVIWFLIMIKMTIGDYVTRGWVYPLSGK